MLSITLKPSLMPLKISTFQDGYFAFFCESEDAFGGGRLNALNTKGEITEFTCEFVPNKPGHNFPRLFGGIVLCLY